MSERVHEAERGEGSGSDRGPEPGWLALLGGARRRPLLVIVLAALLLGGLVLLIGRLEGFGEVLDALRQARPEWLALCLLGEIVAYMGYASVFQETSRFRGGPRLGLVASGRVVFASLAASRVLAAGGAGGLALDYWALRTAGLARYAAATRVLALNTLLYAAFGAAAWIAALALAVGLGGRAPLGLALPWLVGVAALAVAGLWVSRPRRSRAPGARERGRVGRALAVAVAGVVLARRMVTERRSAAVLGASLYWAGDILCLWAALHAFGAGASVAVVVLGYATGYLATLLPLPTAGIGGVEAAMTLALAALGVPIATALLGVLAYRFFAFWLPTLPGLVAASRLPRLAAELEALRPAGPPPSGGDGVADDDTRSGP